MKKIYLSADIEGTCGIAHWEETEPGKRGYEAYARQMTREVAAACEGAVAGGARELLVKDAHHTARNIDPAALPACARILRGWTRDPYVMMSGLDASFYGVMLTGYHSAAGTDGSPLAHTMSTAYSLVTINGEVASECTLSCLIAASLGVPVLMVTGDEALCERLAAVNPHIRTVPVLSGIGNATLSIHPDLAVQRIRQAAQEVLEGDAEKCHYPMPRHLDIEVQYREHALALRNSFYPGALRAGPRGVGFSTDSFDEALRFMLFCL